MLKALIADDHALIRSGLREMLEACAPGMPVLEVENLPQVVDCLSRDPEIGLVLLDLVIPGARGLEGLDLLRQHFPAVAVVVVSADETPALIRRALAAGAAGYLPKSTRTEVMAGALRLVLAGGVYVPPSIIDGEEEPAPERPALDPKTLGLTDRQGEIFVLLGEGLSNRAIGARLGLAEQTVKNQVSQTLRRLGVASRIEAAVLARRYRQV
ncbi:response regulator transcription factor [Falsiroseomonas sp.]|uniref:response regulator transcription factor n=1 Tax=Falsiroseomonas sp. TaxID=2870721 RepID=UPI002720224E|nr:response regulator transcription factor [Falsiroseomonas sp.]MDO9502189.1 response regulator transcription factor [Falsiroseomonas sp.]